MTLRIAINGFGRIGRLVCRAIYEMGHDDIELVAINDPGGNFFPLLKFDSVHGRAPFTVERCGDDGIKINGRRVYRFRSREPEDLHWGDHNVDIVMECTGKFNDREGALTHLKAGAKKVLFSAPAKGEDITVVYGVNHKDIKPEHTIVSNGSCTTNCLAPLAYVLDKEIGIVRGFMTTIHAYTGDQNIIDASHKDPYRARAAGINMIPTTTGAAKALGAVLPNLAGKLDGVAIRVPVPNVSLVDLKFDAARKTTVEEINNAVKKYANGELQGILSYYEEPLVSSDFNHEPYSANFSVNGTNVIDGTFVRVMAWYDNEWGFSCRMVDTALTMHRAGYK
ncbi:MAG: type I glyceraldehyde-3-phosphate dehydrogenase [Alphaproteobacteria bacterium]|jgi:glyceraldehyde 3-phosphate dehydrogenase|nr:type I glyceraldehyde-3-phosphate dehydrogenase [Alphaproteobacteria bacterium]QQS56444.1 MAG: type I glyceraldehyde-3-phosphate dehydrogenase [Alphaproteobacteria bacterium]